MAGTISRFPPEKLVDTIEKVLEKYKLDECRLWFSEDRKFILINDNGPKCYGWYTHIHLDGNDIQIEDISNILKGKYSIEIIDDELIVGGYKLN